MQGARLEKKDYILTSSAIIFYLISLIIAKFSLHYYLSFYFYLGALATVLFAAIRSVNLAHLKSILRQNLFFLLLLLIISLPFHLAFLRTYPLVSVGDELRDGGINAVAVAEGKIQNIFSYVRYEASSFFIPWVISHLYPLIGRSVLLFRLPAALMASLNLVLFFLLLRSLRVSALIAFLTTLLLFSLPWHLFYARTELINLLNVSAALILFCLLRNYLQNRSLKNLILLATAAGFFFNFHATVKFLGFNILLLLLLDQALHWARRFYYQRSLNLSSFFFFVFYLVFFAFLGFGPLLLFTPLRTFFTLHRFYQGGGGTLWQRILSHKTQLLENYYHSFNFFRGQEAARGWYPRHEVFLPPELMILLAVGFLVSLREKDKYYCFLVLTFFLTLTTNSALTDVYNADYRILPLMIIALIFVARGGHWLRQLLPSPFIWHVLTVVVLIFSLLRVGNFFLNEEANKERRVGSFLLTHTIYWLQKQNLASGTINLILSPENKELFQLLHYQEQWQYFLPQLQVNSQSDPNLGENEVKVRLNGQNQGRQIILCQPRERFLCPPQSSLPLIINY